MRVQGEVEIDGGRSQTYRTRAEYRWNRGGNGGGIDGHEATEVRYGSEQLNLTLTRSSEANSNVEQEHRCSRPTTIRISFRLSTRR